MIDTESIVAHCWSDRHTLTDGDIDAECMDQEQLQTSLLDMGANIVKVHIDPLMNPKCTVWDIVDEYLDQALRETLPRRPGRGQHRRQSRQVSHILVPPDGCRLHDGGAAVD
jgi:hypothetical protein